MARISQVRRNLASLVCSGKEVIFLRVGSGHGRCANLRGQVGSRKEDFEISRVGSGRVGSGWVRSFFKSQESRQADPRGFDLTHKQVLKQNQDP